MPEQEAVFSVSGRLAESAGRRRPKSVATRPADLGARVRPDGSFTLPSVPSGSYRLVGSDGDAAETECFVGALTVRDGPVEGVLLQPRAVFSLRGRIRRLGAGALLFEGQTISFVPPTERDCGPNLPLTATTTADGRFSIPNFSRGLAGMRLTPLAGSYVQAVLVAGHLARRRSRLFSTRGW